MLQVVRKNLTGQINLKPTSLHTVVSSPTDALYVEKTLPGDLTLKNMNEVSNNIFTAEKGQFFSCFSMKILCPHTVGIGRSSDKSA